MRHRLFVHTAAAAAAALVLSACSSNSGEEGTTSAPRGTDLEATGSALVTTDPEVTSTAGGAFPVTIDHAFGATTVESEPERVVTVSWQNQDVVLALGVVPVAIPEATYGGDEEGMLPWFNDELGDRPVPELMDETAGVSFEAISAAEPDVIIAAYSGISEEDYATLSNIAPTVAYPEAPYTTDWKDTTRLVGQALGQPEQAEQLIADTQAYISDLGAQYPQLAGKTFAYAAYPSDTELSFYTASDARVDLLTGLGLEVAPSVEALGTEGFFVPVPFEHLDTMQSDILVLLADSEDQRDAMLANPFIANLPQVVAGAYTVLVGEQLVMAASAPSALSIPWSFDQFVPELAAAADRVG